MKEELKKRMIAVIGESVIQTKDSIAEKCAQVAIEYCLEQNQALNMSGVSEWVDVKLRLPEPEQKIFLYHIDGEIYIDIYLMANELYFTHWMPYEAINRPVR